MAGAKGRRRTADPPMPQSLQLKTRRSPKLTLRALMTKVRMSLTSFLVSYG